MLCDRLGRQLNQNQQVLHNPPTRPLWSTYLAMPPAAPTVDRPETGPDLQCPGCGGREPRQPIVCAWCGFRLRRDNRRERFRAGLLAGALVLCLALVAIAALAFQAGLISGVPRP